MTRKVYRTAQGKLVDLGRLQLQHENTRAVGNMGINARGDRIDSRNMPIERRAASVQRQYDRQTQETPSPRKKTRSAPVLDIPAPPEDFQDDFAKEDVAPATTGLAAAIAKAREIRQEPLRSPQQVAKEQEGVRKI